MNSRLDRIREYGCAWPSTGETREVRPHPDSLRESAQRCSITLIRNLSSGIGFGLNFSRKL